MPLHGKVVVLKRSGGDGTEFPLTASCLFGRKPDCDIRIQLPQVSKEHCRIDLNENKEVILTNLSSVNPTCVNGQALQQSERLKHGDVITVIDRSFRFEYPPAPTPKKRSSVGGKAEAVASDPHLKDGANIHNIQRSLEKTLELESKEDVSLSESKTASPFNELYQMIKKSLDVKTPRKSSVSVLQTPSSKFCTPKPESTRKDDTKPIPLGGKSTPKKEQTPVRAAEKVQSEDGSLCSTPKSAKKRRSLQLPTEQTPNAQETTQPETTSPRRKATPQKFSVSEAVEQIATQTPKSPSRRRSKESTSPKSETKQVASPAKTDNTRKATPKSSETAKAKPKKRKSEELAADLPTQQMKRKRVSFGGHLSPELFDKRLPPDSPLRKGAAPRRSLCLSRPKLSLLRRASVIGLLKEGQEGQLVKSLKAKSPAKARTPSPKKSPSAKNASPKTPTPAKKSPKSPKAQSPAQRAASPKAQSPKNKSPSPKTPSSGKKAATPKSASPKTASPKSVKTPTKSPQTPQRNTTPKTKSPARVTPLPSDQTPTVQGRFSVSRISTPSPVAKNAVTEHVPSVNVTPKIPVRRKSMKSSAKKTPALKSATKVMRRKSGLMRSSMKVMTSWADIVRFGKAKVQVAVPTKKQVTKKTKKQTVKTPKKMPQTPVRKLVDHVSTGHAASPATIVVGRAHRLRVAQATGAPPKIVTNTAVLTKNMKMDEDLTGISEIFKTPNNDKRKSVKTERSATKTPLVDVSKSIIEPSVLNTPEETGEMVVSPMTIASTVKGRKYNSEAVQRLLNEQESSFVSDIPSLEIESEPTVQEGAEMTADTPKTPKQNIEKPESLTGVKRLMKTPKQKAEPVEDLRGKLLKTPKQKIEQEECLSAVKRIMKTPKEKGTPVEDLRSKLLKTPKQKIEQNEECLSGVKRIMKTPKEKAVPVEDLRGKLLKTPKQKIEQQEECLSGVKIMLQTPNQKIEQPECLTVVKRVMRTPRSKSEPIDDIRGKLLQTPNQKIEQPECLTGVKRIMTTPKQKAEEEVDTEKILPAVKRIPRTPKDKAQPVEDKFGIKKLMRSPRLRGIAPVEDFEGLEELMKEQPVEAQTCVATEESIVDQSDSTSNDVDVVETIPESAAEAQNEAEMVIATDSETKPVESIEEEKQEKDNSEVEVPAQGQRGKKVGPVQEESAPEPVVKPRRGRNAKKTTQEQDEVQVIPTETTTVPEESEQSLPAVDNGVEESAPSEECVVKPRRGRKAQAVEHEEVTPVSDATPDDQAKESTETMPSVNQEDKSNAVETCEPVVAESAPEVEMAAATQITEAQKKPVRGRRKAVEAKAARKEKEDIPAAVEDKKDEEVSEGAAPVRGRRGKRTNVKEPEEPVQEESAPEVVVKPRRGRITKKSSQEKDVPTESATVPEAESSANNGVDESAPTQECVVKPRRGRKAKAVEPELVTPAAVSDATQTIEAKESTETIQSVNQEEESVAVEPVVAESAPEVGTEAATETVEPCIPEAQKKPVRGRRKAVETKAAHEEKKDIPSAIEDTKAEDVLEEAAPVRGRRGKRTEAPVAPSVRQRRGRAGKSQETTSEEATITPPEKANQVNETALEQADNHTTAANDSDHTEEAVQEKPKRGRKNNKKPAEPQPEPESTVMESEQPVVEEIQITEDTQTEQPLPEKPKRGKRAKAQVEPPQPEPESSAVESEQPVEDTQTEQAATEKPKRGRNTRAATEVPQAPVRGKRGRTAKLEDEEKSVLEQKSEAKIPEPKKVQRAKKAVSHEDKSSEEVQTTEAPEETPVEAVKSDEQNCPAPKARRGAQNTQEAQNDTSEKTSEDVSVSSSTDKPIRGKRGKQVLKESTSAEVTEQVPEDDSANVKPSRARGKTSAKHVPDTVPAKKARRGTAVSMEESTADATEAVTEAAPVEPIKKGRRAAAKAPAEETVSSNQNNSTEESNTVEDTKTSKRSVKWKTDLEIREVTPAKKTARGRKTKSGDQETENGVPQKATYPEEKDLSDKEMQPAKRARRGAKAADVEQVSTKTNVDHAEAEPQPKTRRGRSAKK